MQSFLNVRPVSSIFTQVRFLKKKKIKKWEDPKNTSWTQPLYEYQERKLKEGQEDREPSMLHMVRKIKTEIGRPYWEKDMLKKLHLGGKINQVQVHKNTPEINDMLKVVKHLVEITPITFPHGLPASEADYEHCLLQDNGEFVVKQTLHPSSSEDVKVVDKPSEASLYEMDLDTVSVACRKKLQAFNVNAEYFQAKYVYRYNQDKKEYRYYGDHNIGSNRDWY